MLMLFPSAIFENNVSLIGLGVLVLCKKKRQMDTHTNIQHLVL